MKSFKPKKAKTKKKFSLNKRDSSTRRGYDKSWSKYRFRFLHHNPLCYCCGEKAAVIDHIRAHKGNQELFWNQHNYMPLCKRCHDTITGKFDRHNPPKTEEKIEWVKKERDKNNITIKVKIVSIPRS